MQVHLLMGVQQHEDIGGSGGIPHALLISTLFGGVQ